MPRRTKDISQASTSRANATQFNEMSSDEEGDQNSDLLVTNLIKYILNNSINKHPVKRSGERLKLLFNN
jgi:hypothetical protein